MQKYGADGRRLTFRLRSLAADLADADPCLCRAQGAMPVRCLCGASFVSLLWEVFVVALVLRSWGTGAFSARFGFVWRGKLAFVVVRCRSRSALASLAVRFRRAAAAVRRVPRSVVPSVPLFGLRWLACRWSVVEVSGPGLWSLWVVPAAGVRCGVRSWGGLRFFGGRWRVLVFGSWWALSWPLVSAVFGRPVFRGV